MQRFRFVAAKMEEEERGLLAPGPDDSQSDVESPLSGQGPQNRRPSGRRAALAAAALLVTGAFVAVAVTASVWVPRSNLWSGESADVVELMMLPNGVCTGSLCFLESQGLNTGCRAGPQDTTSDAGGTARTVTASTASECIQQCMVTLDCTGVQLAATPNRCVLHYVPVIGMPDSGYECLKKSPLPTMASIFRISGELTVAVAGDPDILASNPKTTSAFAFALSMGVGAPVAKEDVTITAQGRQPGGQAIVRYVIQIEGSFPIRRADPQAVIRSIQRWVASPAALGTLIVIALNARAIMLDVKVVQVSLPLLAPPAAKPPAASMQVSAGPLTETDLVMGEKLSLQVAAKILLVHGSWAQAWAAITRKLVPGLGISSAAWQSVLQQLMEEWGVNAQIWQLTFQFADLDGNSHISVDECRVFLSLPAAAEQHLQRLKVEATFRNKDWLAAWTATAAAQTQLLGIPYTLWPEALMLLRIPTNMAMAWTLTFHSLDRSGDFYVSKEEFAALWDLTLASPPALPTAAVPGPADPRCPAAPKVNATPGLTCGGQAGQCDAQSDAPCCSKWGTCGGTWNDCQCVGCVDYRPRVTSALAPLGRSVVATYVGASPNGIPPPPLSSIPAEVNMVVLFGLVADPLKPVGTFAMPTGAAWYNATDIRADRLRNPSRKFLVSIGGPAESGGSFQLSVPLQTWVATAKASITQIVRGVGVDGVEVQYTGGTSSPDFKPAVEALIAALKAERLITAIAATPANGADYGALSLLNVDTVHLQMYASRLTSAPAVTAEAEKVAALFTDPTAANKFVLGLSTASRHPQPSVGLEALTLLRSSQKIKLVGVITSTAEYSPMMRPSWCLEKSAYSLILGLRPCTPVDQCLWSPTAAPGDWMSWAA